MCGAAPWRNDTGTANRGYLCKGRLCFGVGLRLRKSFIGYHPWKDGKMKSFEDCRGRGKWKNSFIFFFFKLFLEPLSWELNVVMAFPHCWGHGASPTIQNRARRPSSPRKGQCFIHIYPICGLYAMCVLLLCAEQHGGPCWQLCLSSREEGQMDGWFWTFLPGMQFFLLAFLFLFFPGPEPVWSLSFCIAQWWSRIRRFILDLAPRPIFAGGDSHKNGAGIMWAPDLGTYPGAWHESCSAVPLVPSPSRSRNMVRHWLNLIFLIKQFLNFWNSW